MIKSSLQLILETSYSLCYISTQSSIHTESKSGWEETCSAVYNLTEQPFWFGVDNVMDNLCYVLHCNWFMLI